MKRILFILMMLCLSFSVAYAVTIEDFQNNLIFYASMDAENCSIDNSIYSWDGSLTDTVLAELNVTGGIPNLGSYCEVPENSMVEWNTSNSPVFFDEMNFTFSFWTNYNGVPDLNTALIGKSHTDAEGIKIFFNHGTPNGVRVRFGHVSGTANIDPGISVTTMGNATWKLFTISLNGTQMYTYLNSDLISINAVPAGIDWTGINNYVRLGGEISADGRELQKVDEVFFMNRSITDEEVTFLYNDGDGVSLQLNATPPDIDPVITFINPTVEDGAKNNTQVQITASCNVNNNTFLYFDNQTPPLALVQNDVPTNTTYNTNVTIDGTYYYTANCGGVNTTVRSWVYDSTEPTITVGNTNSFDANNVTGNPFADFLNLSFTTQDAEGLFGFQINVSLNGTEYFSYTNESLNNITSFTFTQDVNTDGFPNGDYLVKVFSSDSHTARQIPHYDTQIIGNKIFYDTAEGNTITIESQAATIPTTEKDFDRYTFTFDFQAPTPNKIFFVECDNDLHYIPDSEYPAHFVCFNWETREGNWIDFLIDGEENLVPQVASAGTNRYRVTYTTNSLSLHFKSIGGLNVNEIDYQWQHSNLTITNVRIDPSNQATKDDDLFGYATGIEALGRALGYQWIWYLNGSVYKTGSYGDFSMIQSEYIYDESHLNIDAGAEWDLSVGGSCNSAIEPTQDNNWVTGCGIDGDGIFNDDAVYINESYDTTNASDVQYKFRVSANTGDISCTSQVSVNCYDHKADTMLNQFFGFCRNGGSFLDITSCSPINYTVSLPDECLTDRPIVNIVLATTATGGACTSGDTHEAHFYEGEMITTNTGTDSPSGTEVSLDRIDDSFTSVGDNFIFSARSVYNPLSNYSNSTPTAVQDIVVNSCTPTVPFPVLNMSYYDEFTNLSISADNGVQFIFTDSLRQYNVTAAFSGNANDVICTNLNSSVIQHNWTMTGSLVLSKSDYGTRQYNYNTPNQILVSNSPTKQLSLFLIPLNESTTVKYNWLSTSFELLDGTMRVFKCNDDGSKTLVSSPLVIDGVASENIELLNQPYFYDIIVDGVLYQDTDSFSQCHLEAQTELTYYVDILQTDISDPLGLYQVQCNVTKTGVDTVKVEWNQNPEDSSPMTGCIIANRLMPSGWQQVYINCTSTSFSIERTIPNTGFDYQVKGKLFQSGFAIECAEEVEFRDSNTAADQFGNTGLFAAIILIISLVLLYASDDQTMMYMAIVGLLASWWLGILNFGWVTASAIIGFLVIIIWIGKSTRAK